MLTLEEIKDRLQDRVLYLVAAKTGLHRNTVAAIRNGKLQNPTINVLRRLSDYLDGNGS